MSPALAFSKTIELEMTPVMMKEIWRTVQKAMFGKASTADLEKQGEIDEIAEHLNRFFSVQFNLDGIALPSMELGFADTAPTHEDYKNKYEGLDPHDL
ncbi:hypothetical protein [Bradyrhizobium sp. AUGA SZCCT0431]|uniref:hypothetical protein n=1 Tax=Bradyrhizobium sp. AUGA SZCCT0431 TaxID=2807674 RepID=UPI001BA91ADD|nr:hypothetical protein [Bradyrhizobium sp. AUGA SZCCT0431]MBR1146657.1 hypothetical protein [Bradyrhizobium sp. AUGA SZCCT0431]